MKLPALFEVNQFQNNVWTWWQDNKREFPWRKTTDPYFILVSEFMLQQTQASRVIPKYLAFINKYATAIELSETSNIDVLTQWSGLGYNKRAIWLRDAANALVKDPSISGSPSELIQLKGIGTYTAHSVPIFAFNADFVTVDVNIKKIMIFEGFMSLKGKDKEFYQLANLLLPLGKSRDWHNALMDYGAANYSKQKYSVTSTNKKNPSFKGSNRYYRGLIIKDLTKQNVLTISYFLNRYQISPGKLTDILDKMEIDGLINVVDNIVKL